jgi:hypothetical protein
MLAAWFGLGTSPWVDRSNSTVTGVDRRGNGCGVSSTDIWESLAASCQTNGGGLRSDWRAAPLT